MAQQCDWLTTSEVGAELGFTYRTIHKYIERGKIQAVRKGSRWLVHVSEVERYKRERKPPGFPKAYQLSRRLGDAL